MWHESHRARPQKGYAGPGFALEEFKLFDEGCKPK
jgi:hypothetical protein